MRIEVTYNYSEYNIGTWEFCHRRNWYFDKYTLVFGWSWRSHVCLFVISVDRVHRPDAGQVPTLQESVSSFKQFIHHITSFSLYIYIVDLHPQAFSFSFYSVKPTKSEQVVASGVFSRTGHTLVFFSWMKPVSSCFCDFISNFKCCSTFPSPASEC